MWRKETVWDVQTDHQPDEWGEHLLTLGLCASWRELVVALDLLKQPWQDVNKPMKSALLATSASNWGDGLWTHLPAASRGQTVQKREGCTDKLSRCWGKLCRIQACISREGFVDLERLFYICLPVLISDRARCAGGEPGHKPRVYQLLVCWKQIYFSYK